jgi:hypothetical protein
MSGPVSFNGSAIVSGTIDAARLPDGIGAEELEPLVPYTLDPERDPQPIVFDPDADYPGA